MHSCLYEGAVTHHRRDPVNHRFRYSLVMAYLDLDELPSLVGSKKSISDRRWSLCSFRRADRLFESAKPLDEEVRGIIAKATGSSPAGPIRLLTQLRWYGYYFSPLNLYYVFDERGGEVEHVLAEVNNTPWGERHVYVLADACRTPRRGDMQCFQHRKEFHVSPFMSMDGDYHWKLGQPGETISVSLSREAPGERNFSAELRLRRRSLSKNSLRRLAIQRPLMTAKVSAAIYYQALKLWWKRCPYYPHPDRMAPRRESTLPTSSQRNVR